MKQINYKKLIIPNIPYLFIALHYQNCGVCERKKRKKVP